MPSYVNDFPFANRTRWSLQHNPLTKTLEKLQAQGISILDLTESNPTRCGFEYPPEWLNILSKQENLIYAPAAQGVPDARGAIVDYYGDHNLKVDTNRLVLTCSTSEGYSFLLKLLTNPGDHVLIPKPSYPLFQFLLELHDVKFDYYPLEYDGRWSIQQKVFQNLMTDRTRAVMVVNPNNPTGSYINRKDLAFLNEQCLKNHMAIICDEVFFDYPLNEGNRNEAIPCLYHNSRVLTFTLNGISKILGLPQMKLAWIAVHGPNDLVKEAMQRLEVIADTYLSVNTPVQNALLGWLAQSHQIQKQILQRVHENLGILRRGRPVACPFTLGAAHWDAPTWNLLQPQGGWYAVIQVPSLQSEESLVLNLLEQEHVLVHPGYFFDFENTGYLVLSLLPESQIFAEGIKRISRQIRIL